MNIINKIIRTGRVTRPMAALKTEAWWPQVDPVRCNGCGQCAAICPTAALAINQQADISRGTLSCEGAGGKWQLDLGKCIGCLYCQEACPVQAIQLGAAATGLTGQDAKLKPISLHLRHLDSGSCNACDWEMTALLNAVYDLQRWGFDFVASPRHADALLVTGAVTRNLREAVEKTYAATPEPKVVIAVGACAVSGGLFNANYTTAGGVNQIIPVDVGIPGCPPTPAAMIAGLFEAARVFAQQAKSMGGVKPITR